MSDKIDDGGPAFPTESEHQSAPNRWHHAGMSLRDWFAGMALQGIASAVPGPGCASWDYYSGASYKIADAMLAARKST